MKKIMAYMVLALAVSSTAYAAGKLPRAIGETQQQALVDFADETFNNPNIKWKEIFHERVKDTSAIDFFNPIRVYYRPHGFYVHTYSSPDLESGYFILREGGAAPKKAYLKLKPIGDRVYHYRIETIQRK